MAGSDNGTPQESVGSVKTGKISRPRKLTDAAVRNLPPPAAGNRITYDAAVRGFGARVTSAGARSFVLNYRHGARERRITIGSYPRVERVAGARAGGGTAACS